MSTMLGCAVVGARISLGDVAVDFSDVSLWQSDL